MGMWGEGKAVPRLREVHNCFFVVVRVKVGSRHRTLKGGVTL